MLRGRFESEFAAEFVLPPITPCQSKLGDQTVKLEIHRKLEDIQPQYWTVVEVYHSTVDEEARGMNKGGGGMNKFRGASVMRAMLTVHVP